MQISPDVLHEVTLLAISVYTGIVLILCYDMINIFRRLIKPSVAREIVEDVIFWTTASLYIFDMFLRYNYGIPRAFVIVLILLTMYTFERIVGRRITTALARLVKRFIITLLKPLKKPLKVIKLKIDKIRVKRKKLFKTLKNKCRKKVKKCRKQDRYKDQNKAQVKGQDRRKATVKGLDVHRAQVRAKERGRRRRPEEEQVRNSEQVRHSAQTRTIELQVDCTVSE